MLARWISLFFLAGALAQRPQPSRIDGTWLGTLDAGGTKLRVQLQIRSDNGGKESRAMASLDQGGAEMPCENFVLDGANLTFEVPQVHGRWHGSVAADNNRLDGTWSQGADLPLSFARQADIAPAAKPSRIDGIWLGTLEAGPAKLRLQLHLRSDSGGQEICSLDSLDQGAVGIPCSNAKLDGANFSFEVPAVQGRWRGTVSSDSNRFDGTWTQGRDLPLVFTRQQSAITPPKAEAPKFDAAAAPVTGDQWAAVLANDLAATLQDGVLSAASGGGVAIGVTQKGSRHVFAYAAAHPDSIFEIGSITKTFTGLLLAEMTVEQKVKLDEPVRALLPANTVPKPDGPEISLLDLATQHSGLPRMPDDFKPADPQDPYVDYHATNLYAFLGKHGVAHPANAPFVYSNLGFGLLGLALADRAGTSYPELLQMGITSPLQMHDTVIQLSPSQQARFIKGYDGQHQPAHAWNLDAFAGAGAIRSTASDMMTYLEAQLQPDSAKGLPALPAALKLSHELRADSIPGMHIALAWFCDSKTGTYWHSGATGGYSSYAFFNPEGQYAGVVLYNASISQGGSFADMVGEHLRERIEGKPAVSLASYKK